jgi:hypothetical protein
VVRRVACPTHQVVQVVLQTPHVIQRTRAVGISHWPLLLQANRATESARSAVPTTQAVEAPTFFSQTAVRLSASGAGRPSPLGRYLVLISLSGSVDPHGHSAAGRIWSIEKSNDLIGNLTRGLPACSTVSQPTTLWRQLAHSTYGTRPLNRHFKIKL